MAFQITWEDDGVLLTFDGSISNDDLLLSAIAVAEDPRFGSIRYSIADLLDVTESLLSVTDTVRHSKNNLTTSITYSGQKVAMVADQPFARPLLKIYQWQMEGSGWDVQLFTTIAEARHWIDEQQG